MSSEQTGFGIIVFNGGGNSLYFHFVDRERFTQIQELIAATDFKAKRWQDRLIDLVGWLTSDESPETDPPSNAPEERKGKLLVSAYTSFLVPEMMKENNWGPILGIVTVP